MSQETIEAELEVGELVIMTSFIELCLKVTNRHCCRTDCAVVALIIGKQDSIEQKISSVAASPKQMDQLRDSPTSSLAQRSYCAMVNV